MDTIKSALRAEVHYAGVSALLSVGAGLDWHRTVSVTQFVTYRVQNQQKQIGIGRDSTPTMLQNHQ
jgi:hypothetical protein